MYKIPERFREQLMFVDTAGNLQICWLSVTKDKESDLVFYSLITHENEQKMAQRVNDIEDWIMRAQDYLPINWKTSEFVEGVVPTATYHLFETCLGPNENILARFTFDGDDKTPSNHWEVVYERNQHGDQEVQLVESAFFNTAFIPADLMAKSYREFIDAINTTPLDFPQLNQTLSEVELRLPCDCYTHELSVLYDEETDCFELAYWQRGKGEQPWGWKTRLKMVWDILTTGNPYSDMIFLKRKNMYKLHEYIEGFMRNAK